MEKEFNDCFERINDSLGRISENLTKTHNSLKNMVDKNEYAAKSLEEFEKLESVIENLIPRLVTHKKSLSCSTETLYLLKKISEQEFLETRDMCACERCNISRKLAIFVQKYPKYKDKAYPKD